MPDPALLALTWRVTRQRLAASPLAIVAGLAFPAFVVWIGLHDSYDSAAKFFFFLLPHAFLVAAQDAVRSDVESGALESVLFLGGRWRKYLSAKSGRAFFCASSSTFTPSSPCPCLNQVRATAI